MTHIFIIGSKGIPAKYGGFETFVEQLTARRVSKDIKYHVSCLSDNNEEFEYNEVRCFNVKVKKIGGATAVIYDILSLRRCIQYIKTHNLKDCIVYILACRIGPFLDTYKKKLLKLGVKLYVNPDGHEWKRSKWNFLIKKYWKFSEKLMVKQADLLICDSNGIESYILDEYAYLHPKTTFISYGAEIGESIMTTSTEQLESWFRRYEITSKNYYLIVGRFVPENNYELMIKEFMKSDTEKDLVIISNLEKNGFYKKLLKSTAFKNDKRIKFVGTVYDQVLLAQIREQAYGYLHGHEVGGTNPSLLEALASTKLNLLLDVVFNKEVAQGGALYFTKEQGSLSGLIEQLEKYSLGQINMISTQAKERIASAYSWERIVNLYESLFLGIEYFRENESQSEKHQKIPSNY
jgi:rhamnosyltransferase